MNIFESGIYKYLMSNIFLFSNSFLNKEINDRAETTYIILLDFMFKDVNFI